MQFCAQVVFSLLILAQQVVSLQQTSVSSVVIEAAGSLVTDHALASPTTVVGAIDFGGSHHGIDGKGHNMRPELVKMQVCDDDSTCGACTQQTACWHGYGNGQLELHVPANSAHNRFEAEVWASCSNGKGQWRVFVFPNGLRNGVLNIYVDGELFKTAYSNSQRWTVAVPIVKNSRVRVEFVRTRTGAKAFGHITLKARGVDEYVDDCMGVKDCLAKLGDGTNSAFSFRNSNVQQLDCITATTTDARNKVSDHCEPWDACLAQKPGRKEKLKTLLKAALGTSGSLTENETRRKEKPESSQKRSCMDPAIEDAEAWQCECMAEMTEDCDDDEEACLRKFFCKSSKICDSWKKSNNCETSLIAKQNASALIVRRRDAGDDSTIGARLDGALSGKCASQ